MTRPVRTCAREGGTRATDWPRDPRLLAAYCRDHTSELLIPATVPEWVARARAHTLPGRIEGGVPL